jgi:DNA (cytosine-5)-methyltransferase 1
VNELHLFAGAGGGILGGELLGHRTVCAVEIEEYPRKVLLQRQRDGILPWFPIWDDITTFDGRPWKGRVDIVSGGFPCQDISAAGKGAGIDGERSGLWGEMARVVFEVSPRFVFVENSPMLTSRGLHRVLGDLAEMGYDARWCVLGADDTGAPHRRKRIWILAYAKGERYRKRGEAGNVSKTDGGQDRELCPEFSGTSSRSEDNANYVAYSMSTGKRWEQRESEVKTDVVADCDKINVQGYIRKNIDEEEREKQGKRQIGSQGAGNSITWWDTDPAEVADTGCNDGEQRHNLGFQKGQTERTSCTIQNQSSSQRYDRERPAKPIMGRVAHGVAHRVDRLKAIGNGQVPAVAALAFTILSEGLI